MIPFELALGLLLGLGFASCARTQFEQGCSPFRRELAAVLSFELLAAWPVMLYLHLVYPDWSWLYLVDPRRLPRVAGVLVLLGQLATVLGGYLVGWLLVRRRRAQVLYGLLGGGASLALVVGLLLKGRLSSAGTFAQYHAGRAPDLVGPGGSRGRLSVALVITGVGLAISLAYVAVTVWREGRRYRESGAGLAEGHEGSPPAA